MGAAAWWRKIEGGVSEGGRAAWRGCTDAVTWQGTQALAAGTCPARWFAALAVSL